MQKAVTLIVMVRMTIEAIVPTILSLFIGVWSDTHGRKPLVVWPLFGKLLNTLLSKSLFLLVLSRFAVSIGLSAAPPLSLETFIPRRLQFGLSISA